MKYVLITSISIVLGVYLHDLILGFDTKFKSKINFKTLFCDEPITTAVTLYGKDIDIFLDKVTRTYETDEGVIVCIWEHCQEKCNKYTQFTLIPYKKEIWIESYL